jgi:hypothetical protein
MHFRKGFAYFVAIAAALAFLIPATTAAAAPGSCASYPGSLCAWENANYGGAMAHFAGSNTNWSNFGKSDGGTWNDVTSSAFNNGGGSYNVALYGNASYSGFDECISVGASSSALKDFSNISTGTFPWDTFNDSVSSNKWFAVGSSFSCSHWN